MRAVIQRVQHARVCVAGEEVARIGRGLLVLLGVARGDTPEIARRMAAKIAHLRIFDDASGRMNLDVSAVAGAVLVVSQFTLLADTRKGHRPGYTDAAPAAEAIPLYEGVVAHLRALGLPVATGRFGAHMQVELVNDGPVTIILEELPVAQPAA